MKEQSRVDTLQGGEGGRGCVGGEGCRGVRGSCFTLFTRSTPLNVNSVFSHTHLRCFTCVLMLGFMFIATHHKGTEDVYSTACGHTASLERKLDIHMPQNNINNSILNTYF